MILLDTHALVWWQQEPSPLPTRVWDRIARAKRVYVSAISCWEVATLASRGRIQMDRPLGQWIADMRAEPQIRLHPLSPDAAIQVLELERTGFHPDPADRLLYATALGLGVPFITRDARIRRYARSAPPRLGVEVLWDEVTS